MPTSAAPRRARVSGQDVFIFYSFNLRRPTVGTTRKEASLFHPTAPSNGPMSDRCRPCRHARGQRAYHLTASWVGSADSTFGSYSATANVWVLHFPTCPTRPRFVFFLPSKTSCLTLLKIKEDSSVMSKWWGVHTSKQDKSSQFAYWSLAGRLQEWDHDEAYSSSV